MPNYVDVVITLKSKNKKIIKKFIEKFKKEGFEGFIPIPRNLKDVNEQVDFTYKHWGTKGIEPQTLNTGDNYIVFISHWSPPYEFLLNVSKDYPEIEFTLEWIDDGEIELHKHTIKNGKEINYKKYLHLISDDIDLYEDEIEYFMEKIEKVLKETDEAIIDDEHIKGKEKILKKVKNLTKTSYVK